MDRYLFLLLGLAFLAIDAGIFFLRRDLRKMLLWFGVLGGIAGIVADIWYLQDYWRPPTLFDLGPFSPEDIITGVGIMGVSASIFDTVFQRQLQRIEPPKPMLFAVSILIQIAAMAVFSSLLSFNSLLVSLVCFASMAAIILLRRSDLLLPSLTTGALLTLIVFAIYVILFGLLSPRYWDSYWLLANTVFDIRVTPGIPLTELLWYFLWGCFAGAAKDYFLGTRKVLINTHDLPPASLT